MEWAFTSFVRLVETEIGQDKAAAVILEPVQGESGFLVTPLAFMKQLVEYCKKSGILFIADEIQTAFGRTGNWFAVEHYGVTTGLFTIAKSVGAGLPLAAVVGCAEVMDVSAGGRPRRHLWREPGRLRGALKTIEVIARDGYDEKGADIGEKVHARFRDFQKNYALVGNARGLGAMVAMELVTDRTTKEAAAEKAAAIFKRCCSKGLIVMMKAGQHNQVIRFLAPLNITSEQLGEGLDILEEALAAESPRA